MSDENKSDDTQSASLPWSSIDPADDFSGDLMQEPEKAAAPSGGWTIAVLCLGLALIAACVIIPQADANRRLAYERQRLQMDLHQIQKQVSVNEDFLGKIETDPQLAERLARRQMKVVPKGETVLDISSSTELGGASDMSPFNIVKIPAPPELTPYQPVGGLFNELCRKPQSQLYVLGIGMVLIAAGLVLGDKSPVRVMVAGAQNINSRD